MNERIEAEFNLINYETICYAVRFEDGFLKVIEKSDPERVLLFVKTSELFRRLK